MTDPRQEPDPARDPGPDSEVERKLKVIREAVQHESPTGDIETMLAEIEEGYIRSFPPIDETP